MTAFPPTITSLQNAKIKQARRLRESSGARRDSGLFLIDGEHEIAQAWSAGIQFVSIYMDAVQGLPQEGPAWLSADLWHLVQPVTADVLSRLSYGQRGANPVAVARHPALDVTRLQLKPSSLVLVLDRTEKPGNVGACLRSAAACDAAAVVLTDPVCELFNPNAIRASRGAIFSVPLAVCSPPAFFAHCQQVGLRQLFAARVDAQRTVWDCPLGQGGAIIFGNEADGLGESWCAPEIISFTIPMSNRTDSLNLSISAAVTLYEAVRQRRDLNPL